jgi:hypothetical protein
MIPHFEQRISHKLLCTHFVGQHPLSAGEERRLDTVLAQEVDDASLISSNLMWLLT